MGRWIGGMMNGKFGMGGNEMTWLERIGIVLLGLIVLVILRSFYLWWTRNTPPATFT